VYNWLRTSSRVNSCILVIRPATYLPGVLDVIMAHLKKHEGFIKFLIKASPEQRKAVLRHIDKSQLQCLSECAKNVITGNIPTSKRQLTLFRKHKGLLRTIVSKRVDIKTKKKKVIQEGGGLIIPSLLAAAIPALISLFASS
jgi:hypothetical protein